LQLMLEKLGTTHWKYLNWEKEQPKGEVKAAYQAMSRIYHPDQTISTTQGSRVSLMNSFNIWNSYYLQEIM
jgi:hypothetical protein